MQNNNGLVNIAFGKDENTKQEGWSRYDAEPTHVLGTTNLDTVEWSISSGPRTEGEYTYYHKRGNVYYFKNEHSKFAVEYDKDLNLKKGDKYQVKIEFD